LGELTEAQINRAFKWAANGAIRAAYAGLKEDFIAQMPRNLLHHRLRRHLMQGTGLGSGNLWFGYNPMTVTRSNSRSTGHGIQTARHFYLNGFYLENKAYKRVGRARIPIQPISEEFEEEPIQKAFKASMNTLERVFDELFARYLKDLT
jgi:hypothetical protein